MATVVVHKRSPIRFLNTAHGRSIVGIAGLLGLVGLALGAMNQIGILDLSFIRDNWTFLLGPALTALAATSLSFVAGFALGIPIGLLRAFGPNILRRRGLGAATVAPFYAVATAYVEAVRGTPAFVQILLIHSAATQAFPTLPGLAFWAGVAALFVNTAGYQSEVFRGGFQSIGQGQIEAAKSIGMRPVQVFAHITFPQSVRLILLPLGNEWIGLFKASALLWYVAVQELMWAGSFLSYHLVHPVEAFLMVAFVYLIIIIPLGKTVSWLERRYRIPGLGLPELEGRRLRGKLGWLGR